MDVEEFEPILSDEDILDDTEHYQEAEYDYTAYTNNDDIIRQFNPGIYSNILSEGSRFTWIVSVRFITCFLDAFIIVIH